MFLFDGDRLAVFSDGGAEEDACVTISPDNEFRLERRGDEKFTALHLWEDKIMRDDKCFKEDADNILKEVSSVEICKNKSYYVSYLDGIYKHEEFCSKEEGIEKYNEIRKSMSETGVGGVVLSHKGKVIMKTMSEEVPTAFMNEINIVSLKNGKCLECTQPDRMLCSNQRMEESVYNSFNDFEEEQRLMKYCMKMRDVDDFRCGRANRQKYIHFPQPEDYCLQIGKTVYIQFPDVVDEIFPPSSNPINNPKNAFFNNILIKNDKPVVVNPTSIQNLLGEHYADKYTIFIKAMLKTDTSDSNKFKLLFDTSILSNIDERNFGGFSINKKSEYICLNYKLKPQMLKVGSKGISSF